MTHQDSHIILSPGKVGIYERERESWETGEAEYMREAEECISFTEHEENL